MVYSAYFQKSMQVAHNRLLCIIVCYVFMHSANTAAVGRLEFVLFCSQRLIRLLPSSPFLFHP